MPSFVRRWLTWYFGDPGRRLVVWAAWAAVVALAGGFVGRYGRDIPMNDEWAFVPDFFAPVERQTEWVFERHSEHRYPLARGLFLTCLHLSGDDFRAALWVSLGVSATAAGCLIIAARRFRGTTEYTDALFPVLLLHRGHCEDQLMGYQLAFTLTVLGLCGFLLAVACSRTRPRLLPATLCAAVVACGGGVGVAFAPLLCLWVVWRAWAARRGWIAAVLAVGVLGYSGWAMNDALSTPRTEPRNSLPKAIEVIGQTVEGSLGQALSPGKGKYGLAALTAAGAVAGWLLWKARRAETRSDALGLLAVLVGGCGFVAAIGLSRDNGHAFRFTAFSQFLPIVGLLTVARFLPNPRPVWYTVVTTVLATALAVVILRLHWKPGRDYADRYADAYRQAERDAAAGVPIDFLAERNTPYFSTGFPQFWPILQAHGVGPAANAPPPRPLRTEPTTFRPDPTPDPRLDPPLPGHQLVAVAVPTDRPVLAVRVRFIRPDLAQFDPFRFRWIDESGRPHAELLQPWLLPIESSIVLWLNGRVRGVWVELPVENAKVELRSVELLYPADGPTP